MVAQAALIGWIFISIALFAVFSPLRAFLLTYIIGILFLPVEFQGDGVAQGVIVITQSLRLEKYVACNLGAILGTLIFAPAVFRRFRFQWADLAIAVVLVGEFATSIINNQGAKDGFSIAFEVLRDYVPLIILARLYLTSVNDVYQAFRAILGGALVYAFICVWEWRMSPQLHRDIYGYFQHGFLQYMRDGHFRPAGFLRHAIEVSTFMGLSTALAAWLWFKKIFKPLWGIVPIWLITLLVGMGLLTTMTVAGEGEMLLCAGLLGLIALTRSRWVLLILPLASILWMAGRYTSVIPDSLLHQTAANFVNEDRLQSLDYRLNADRLNLSDISNHVLLGKGPENGFARDDNGQTYSIAIDAWWILQLVFFGIVGIVAWYAVWCACIYETFMRWPKLTPDLQTMAAAVCILIGAQFVDFLFNSFPSMFLLMLNVGIVSTLQCYKAARPVQRVRFVPAAEQPLPSEAVLP